MWGADVLGVILMHQSVRDPLNNALKVGEAKTITGSAPNAELLVCWGSICGQTCTVNAASTTLRI